MLSGERERHSDDLTDKRFKDYDTNMESKEAFIRGFLEGLRRSENIGSEMYTKFMDMIKCQEIMDEPTADPLLIENSLAKMIENNQNITHRSLTDWENKKGTEAGDDITVKGKADEFKSPLAGFLIQNSRNSETISRSSSEPKLSPVNHSRISDTHNSKSDEKIRRAKSHERVEIENRKLLNISKTNIHFDLTGRNASDVQSDDEDQLDKDAHEKWDKQIPRLTTPKVADKPFNENWSKNKYWNDNSKEERFNSPDLWMRKVTVKLKEKRHKKSNRNKTPKIAVLKEDNSIKGFESPLSNTSANVENTEQDTCTDRRKRIKKADAYLFDSFDGWPTSLGPLSTNDSLHLSLSESLHPIESFDHLEVQEKSSTLKDHVDTPDKIGTPKLDKKDLHYSSNQNSPFLPHETLGSNDKTYETSAFKAHGGKTKRKPLLTDIKGKSDLVKLRLTSSCCESPSSNRNIPISRSQSLQNRKKFLSDINIAKNIDLSEKLAHQLRDMRKEDDKRTPQIKTSLTYQKSSLSSRESNKSETCHASSNGLPRRVDSDNAKEMNQIHLSLPQIFTNRATTPEKPTQDTEEVTAPQPPVRGHYLPPISGKSILSIQRTKSGDVSNGMVNEYQHALMPVAVPAENSVLTVNILDKPLIVTSAINSPRSKGHTPMLCATCGGLKSIKMPDNPIKCTNTVSEETNSKLETKESCEADVVTNTAKFADESEKDKSKSASGQSECDKENSKNSAKHQTKDGTSSFKDTKVHIEYKDKDIKLTCDVTVTSSVKDRESTDDTECKLVSRIDDTTVASHEIKVNKNKENIPHPRIDQISTASNEPEINENTENKTLRRTEENVAVSNKTGENENKNENKLPRRIDEMAMAPHREKLECPVMKETGIYGAMKKLQTDEDFPCKGDITPREATTPSAYVEYCKRREQMRALKQDIFHEDINNFVSDTLLSDLVSNVRKAEGRFLPVIPKRRSYDSMKHKQTKKSKLCQKSKSLMSKPEETDKQRTMPSYLVVTPCSLPVIRQKR